MPGDVTSHQNKQINILTFVNVVFFARSKFSPFRLFKLLQDVIFAIVDFFLTVYT